MVSSVRIGDLPDALIDASAGELSPFSVALVRSTPPRVHLLGSGTLVQHKNVYGILTARHVVKLVRADREVDLVVQPKAHRFTVPTEYLDVIESPAGTTDESGPDIAFLRIPDALLGTIKALRLFVNLEHHKRKMDARTAVRANGPWCVFGFPDERSSRSVDTPDGTFCLFGQAGVGTTPERYSAEGAFDYCWVKCVYSQTNDLPTNYGGVSGGGLWSTDIVEERGTFRIKDYILSGVAFYQTARSGNTCFIKCHGHRSIFSWLLDQLETKYAS